MTRHLLASASASVWLGHHQGAGLWEGPHIFLLCHNMVGGQSELEKTPPYGDGTNPFMTGEFPDLVTSGKLSHWQLNCNLV